MTPHCRAPGVGPCRPGRRGGGATGGPMTDGFYNAWRLTSLTPLPRWALALLGLAAAAAGGARLARAARRAAPRRGGRCSWPCAAASALLAVLPLVEPALELLRTARVRNRFAVLVDTSRSMRFPVEAGGPTRADAAASLLADHRGDLSRLADRVDVEFYGFAGDVAPTSPDAAERGLPADRRQDRRARRAGGGGGGRRRRGGVRQEARRARWCSPTAPTTARWRRALRPPPRRGSARWGSRSTRWPWAATRPATWPSSGWRSTTSPSSATR